MIEETRNTLAPIPPFPPIPEVTETITDDERNSLVARVAHLEHRIRNLEQGHITLGEMLEKNTTVTEGIKRDTAALVTIFTMVDDTSKKGARLFLLVMRLVKYAGGIAAALGAIWYIVNIIRSGGQVDPNIHFKG